MDISKYVSDWLSADSISTDRFKPTVAIIQTEGNESDGKFGKQIYFEIEIDGTTTKYRPNNTSLRNIAKRYGQDTMAWVGKKIELIAVETLVSGQVKKMVLAL